MNNGIISRNNFYCFRITYCNFCGNISTKAWYRLKGLNFDKFQIIISHIYRIFTLDIWEHLIDKETAKENIENNQIKNINKYIING